MADRFNGVLYGVSEDLKEILSKIPINVKQSTEEIRLRDGLPLALTVAGETVFVRNNGQTCPYPSDDMFFVKRDDINNSFRRLCNNSAFAHTDELRNGYLRLKSGNRAGIFGTVNARGDMENVTCINIRIAREIKGCATKIATAFRGEGWLIAGPPASGKTTILRDFIRQISNGNLAKSYRVAVIDSRGEISADGENDLGIAADVLNIADKAKGIEIAVRTMFPQVVAFDEIGTVGELNRVKEGFNSGVSVITTAHIGNVGELFKRQVTRELIMSGAVSRVAVLSPIYGGDIRVFAAKELENEYI